MKLGPVLSYKNVDEAEKLERKKVVASENLYLIEDEAYCREYAKRYKITLAGARKGPYPFIGSDGNNFQFIREVIEDEPEYEPYDLSDRKVRDSLRGRWFRDEYDNEVPVSLFDYHKNRNVWQVNGYSSKSFLEKCKWLDGTPCGRRVE